MKKIYFFFLAFQTYYFFCFFLDLFFLGGFLLYYFYLVINNKEPKFFFFILLAILGFMFRINIIELFSLDIHSLLDYLLSSVPVVLLLKIVSFTVVPVSKELSLNQIKHKIIHTIIFCIFIFFFREFLLLHCNYDFYIYIIGILLYSEVDKDLVFLMNNPVNMNTYNNHIQQLHNGAPLGNNYPAYVNGGSNQPHLTLLAAEITYYRDVGGKTLSKNTFTLSGENLFKGYLRATNFQL